MSNRDSWYDEILHIVAGQSIEQTGRSLHDQARHLTDLADDMTTGGIGRHDPVRSVLSRLGDRWSCLVLMLLTHGPLRHAALRRLINLMRHPAEPEITQRILTLRLRDLEFNGLIARTIFEEKVVRVEYSLTDLGRDMMKYVAELNYFLLANADRIAQARAAFSQKQGHELP